MTRALHSAIGLPSSSISAFRMLALVMPVEVRRNLMIPPGKANELAVAFFEKIAEAIVSSLGLPRVASSVARQRLRNSELQIGGRT
jgi:hypothetical protein